ncbi:hypothetical protein [Methyloceanibacter stevinii]|uniref:hypothetical protein n=1 Tax=Methyloceanibacter stevinii TaxID=1774970 RepID=UPI00114C8572|nr:hypothetical protein [Methyloceanibacter stevinii]
MPEPSVRRQQHVFPCADAAPQDQSFAVPDRVNQPTPQALGLYLGCVRWVQALATEVPQDQRGERHIADEDGPGHRPPDEPPQDPEHGDMSQQCRRDREQQAQGKPVQRIHVGDDARQNAFAAQLHEAARVPRRLLFQ